MGGILYGKKNWVGGEGRVWCGGREGCGVGEIEGLGLWAFLSPQNI